jgi:hypothetical protein
VEGGARDVPVLRGPAGVEVAFTAVQPRQRIVGAVESQEFDDGALPSTERILGGLERL